MRRFSRKIIEGAEIILFKCGNLRKGEKVCIISEPETINIGRLLENVAFKKNIHTEHLTIRPLKMHGQEPPKTATLCMFKSDLVIGLTKLSMAHTKARYEMNKMGARYLSLPDYSIEILKHQALRVNFKAAARQAKRLAERFSQADNIHVYTAKGTRLTLNIRGRKGNFCPGYVDEQSKLGSPPDIESNIAPNEDQSEGIIVVDGSIAFKGFGRLKQPLYLIIKKGKVIEARGETVYVKRLNQLFSRYGRKSRILAEFGVGFNKESKVCGNMLLDEGAYDTFHVGFGSNSTIGGMNKIHFHLDAVFYSNAVILDGQSYIV